MCLPFELLNIMPASPAGPCACVIFMVTLKYLPEPPRCASCMGAWTLLGENTGGACAKGGRVPKIGASFCTLIVGALLQGPQNKEP